MGERGWGLQIGCRGFPAVSVRLGDSFSTPADEVAAGVSGAEVLCVALARVDAAVFEAAESLRLVVKCGIGKEKSTSKQPESRAWG